MIRWLELPAFLGLAMLVHLLPFGFGRESGEAGARSDGDGTSIAVEASSTDLAALVAVWESAPEASDPPQPREPRPAPTVPPAATPAETAPPATPDLPLPAAPAPISAERGAILPVRPSALPPANALPTLPEVQRPPEPAPLRLEAGVPEPAPTTPQPAELSPRPLQEQAFTAPQSPERLSPPATGTTLQTSLRPVARPRNRETTVQPASPPPASMEDAVPSSPPARSAGNAESSASGSASTSGAGGVSDAKARNLLARWGGGIRARIARQKRYPAAAGGTSGTATVMLNIGSDGRLKSARIAQSSGNAALDAAALAAVRRAAPFARAPRALAKPQYGFTVPLRFTR